MTKLPSKRYTILGQSSPMQTLEYQGLFVSVPGQADIITALAIEFASGDLQELIVWLGDETLLRDIAADDETCEFTNDDTVFRVRIDTTEQSRESTLPSDAPLRLRKAAFLAGPPSWPRHNPQPSGERLKPGPDDPAAPAGP